jgi:predicted phage-related endonuclease
MKTIELVQGSPEWHAHRAVHFNASDAPAMMACSKYKTRTQLLQELKSGIAPEVDSATQRRFDEGHRIEGLARPLAAATIGEDLYPVVGVSGELSASFDGLTMAEDIAFEHKTLNDELRAAMTTTDGAALPLAYRVQMEQQCLVSGCEKVLFLATKWEGNELVERREAWYFPDLALRAQIVAGWKQFARDLATFSAPVVAIDPVGRAPESLPALHIVLKGEVSASNLAEFKDVALTAIRSVNRDLKTDQDFADSAKARKWCEDIEERVAAAKNHALSQTMSIDLLFRTMDEVSAEAREVRLALEKLEKGRKESRKGEIVAGGIAALADHIASLNTRLGKSYMPAVPTDFGGAVKGLRTFDSMQNAVDTALAKAKINADAIADRIDANLKYLDSHAAEHVALFPDVATIALKQADDFAALVQTRLADFKAQEDKRKADAAATLAAIEPAASPAPAVATPVAPAPTVIAIAPRARPAAYVAPTLSIGSINERLVHFTTTEAGLRGLGFEPAGRERAAPRYHESDFPHILASIVAHVQSIQAKQAA